MQKILIKSIAAVVLIIAVISVAAYFAITYEKKEAPEETTVSVTQTALYTLSDYNGKIALYKNGFSMPVEIYDVYISSLPQDEQQTIITGLTAYSDEEAERIIEDYTS